MPICRQEMKIVDLDNLLNCRHKRNNFTKFSLYVCNIKLDAYGRLYWGTFLGHKTIIVSFYALKQTLFFCIQNMSYFWTYGRNVEISVHKIKLFPNISSESSLISWGTIFNTFLLGQKFLRMHIFLTQKFKCLFQGIKWS